MSNSVFDKLISGLTNEERQNLMDKLKTVTVISQEPLTVKEPDKIQDFEESLSKLTIFERIFIFLKSLFTATEKERVIRDHLIDKLGKTTEKQIPEMINYREKIFTEEFYNEVEHLKLSVSVLKDSVSTALELNKMNFLAFLGGWFLPEIEERFLKETDPWVIEKNMESPAAFEIKREIEFRMENILGSISEEDRRILYRHSRSLHILNTLLKFDFDLIISKFSIQPGKKWKTCRFTDLRKPLGTLSNILFSFKYPPEEEIFKVLFYYFISGRNTDTVNNENLVKYLELAEDAMNCIRDFNKKIPLTNVVKILYRNININPVDISGGEDWYALYKKFWYKQFDLNMLQFSLKKKTEKLLNQICNFLREESFSPLDYYRNGIWGDDIKVRYELSAGTVYIFLRTVFMQEMLPALKLILVDGKFYKEQNRIDFNKSYSAITKTLENLKVVDTKLSPGGDYDIQIQLIKKERLPDSLKIERIKKFLVDIDSEIESIIRELVDSLYLMSNIITGITHGEIGGPFDTLSNLGFIGKGENNDLIPNLVKIRFKIDNFLELFTQIFDVEREAVFEQ